MDTKYPTDKEVCTGPMVLPLALILGITGMAYAGSFVLAIDFIAQLLSETANALDDE